MESKVLGETSKTRLVEGAWLLERSVGSTR